MECFTNYIISIILLSHSVYSFNAFRNEQVKEVAKEDLAACTRERVEAQQELLHLKNIQARELKDHERVMGRNVM